VEVILFPGNNGGKIAGDLSLYQCYARSQVWFGEGYRLTGVPDKVSQPAYRKQIQQPEDDQDGPLLTFHGCEYSMEELG
jgi:hypothetical protein